MDLLKAVKLESLEKIKELTKKQGIARDAKWTDYKTLNAALECNRKDVAMFLLEQNCRVNKTTKSAKTSTPLHYAVTLGDVQIVKKLLEKQASVLAIDSEKNTPLHLAFINKNEVLVDLLIESIHQAANYVNLKNNHGLSHLHIACTAKNGQTILGFLDGGANIEDAVDEKSPYWAGFTAMHFAVNYKCLDAVSTLLKRGAKHETKTSDGKTPLDIACQSIEDLLIIIDLLKEKTSGSKWNDMYDFLKKSSKWNDMYDLLKKRMTVDIIEPESEHVTNLIKKSMLASSSGKGLHCGLTNFHLACLNENEKIVEKFINYGADINSRTASDLHICSSSTTLHCAVASKCKKKVQLLLNEGLKLHYTNSEGMNPLHLALYNEKFAFTECREIVDLLYAAVEDKMLDQTDIYGMSYFHVAITRNDLEIVKAYLDRDRTVANKIISVNPHEFQQFSPLHVAVKYHKLEIVELLLNYGANINAISQAGTPLHIAFNTGNVDIIDLLLKQGARVDLSNPLNNQTVLHCLVNNCCFLMKSTTGNKLYKDYKSISFYIEHLVKLGVDTNSKDVRGNTALHNMNPMLCEDINCFQLLLDLGADVNAVNVAGSLPFQLKNFTSQAYNYQSLNTYYHHVQKLKALGMKIHPKNEETCKLIVDNGKFEEGELASMEQKRLDEIAKFKSIRIGDATTLCDFIKLDSRRAALFAQSKALKKIAMDSELKEKYPFYGYLIRLQYNMAVKSYKNKNLPSKGDVPGKCNDLTRQDLLLM